MTTHRDRATPLAEERGKRTNGGPPGRIFSVQRFSIHDGPGIRTTVFFKGCPLVCDWCHNPEGRAAPLDVWMIAARCIRCGACLDVCPQPKAPVGNAPPGIDRDRCTRCGACVDVCPTAARLWLGRELRSAELVEELARDAPFFARSGGGITFSGGEPLGQADFLLACLDDCSRRGLHTAVDTSGHGSRAQLRAVAERADLILFDLKQLDAARHRAVTGVDLGPILANLRDLDARGAAVWVRWPLIPGVNDDRLSLDRLGSFVSSLDRTRRVHLLPYHATGAPKGERVGRASPSPGYRRPTPAEIEVAARRLRDHGLEVHVGG